MDLCCLLSRKSQLMDRIWREGKGAKVGCLPSANGELLLLLTEIGSRWKNVSGERAMDEKERVVQKC